MPPSEPSGRAGIFAKLRPAGTAPPRRQILFLRGQKDHLQFNALSPECRAALVAFLDKCWSDFATACRATLRNPEYSGLVTVLTHPYNQEWYPRWVVHWHIDPKLGAEPPYALEDYVLKVERLTHLP